MLGEPKLWLFPNRYLMKSPGEGNPPVPLQGCGDRPGVETSLRTRHQWLLMMLSGRQGRYPSPGNQKHSQERSFQNVLHMCISPQCAKVVRSRPMLLCVPESASGNSSDAGCLR